MPSSCSNGKAMIQKVINGMITGPEFRVLDVGCGKGIYGKLINVPCVKVGLDAVDYVRRFNLFDIYDEFVLADISDETAVKKLGFFDLIIMGDVLEHLTFQDARRTLNSLEENANCIIVAVPYLYPQDGGENPYETHKQPELTRELFLERYPEFDLIKEYNHNGEPFYGYFIWRREARQNAENV